MSATNMSDVVPAMTTANIIDGKAIAERHRAAIQCQIAELSRDRGIVPGLAVVLVGDDPASHVYVRNKRKFAEQAGMNSFAHLLPAETAEAELLDLIGRLNTDPSVHGILVQLPLPAHIDTAAVINAIDPQKDVDGFHVENVGRLATGQDGLVPCTPLGCMILLRDCLDDLAGCKALVIGQSNIVGKPMARLLLAELCTVTVAHARTRDLARECRAADILICAAGQPYLVKGDWIKPGAVVIDVGINRIAAANGRTRLIGDVDFEAARQVAGYITPVPGGVGPMTIACLLANTLKAARRQIALADQKPLDIAGVWASG
jgi:methylenetetrahydrofolate dehydrogenase (NADP+) / methenyltetrahydrofolate cyclohydrolase